jgi:hypothetical protein
MASNLSRSSDDRNVWLWLTSDIPDIPIDFRSYPNSRHSRADVRFRGLEVRSTPNKRHSGRGWECLKMTQPGSWF